jgi:hypothetical protein
MKKFLIASALSILATASVAEGLKPIGYPGSTWSVLTLNPGVIRGTPEDNNVLLQGKIEQGIDWFRIGTNWKFNTYASLGYSWDKNGLDYNNKLVPAVGLKFSRTFDSGVVDLGVQLVNENHFRSTATTKSGTGAQAYASYWFGWNLK